MKLAKLTLDELYRITIPIDIARRMGIKRGQLLGFRQTGEKSLYITTDQTSGMLYRLVEQYQRIVIPRVIVNEMRLKPPMILSIDDYSETQIMLSVSHEYCVSCGSTHVKLFAVNGVSLCPDCIKGFHMEAFVSA